MLSYIIIAISSYLLGIFSVIFFYEVKANLKCSEKDVKEDFGQIAYDELNKKQREKIINDKILNIFV